MIAFNRVPVNLTQFPDGTSSFRFDLSNLARQNTSFPLIEWYYDGDQECIILWYLVKHIRSILGPDTHIGLYMPYVPNARMDRVKSGEEVFTLKWFADFINTLHFSHVGVLDPHSNVLPALINNVEVIQPDQYIEQAISIIQGATGIDNLLMCYPDEGAAKRYSDLLESEYVFGIKHRDWRTGKIERLELTTPEKVKGKNVLIVDDICSRGGTFTFISKALKDAGAESIYLYVTHCEDTIFKGEILTNGLIAHIFTTHSIYRGSSDKITVL